MESRCKRYALARCLAIESQTRVETNSNLAQGSVKPGRSNLNSRIDLNSSTIYDFFRQNLRWWFFLGNLRQIQFKHRHLIYELILPKPGTLQVVGFQLLSAGARALNLQR